MTSSVQLVFMDVPTDRGASLNTGAVNTRGTPQGNGLAHPPNWITNVCHNFWPLGEVARFHGPTPGESSVVPIEDCVGLNSLQTSPSTEPASAQRNPRGPVAGITARKLTSRATRDWEVQT
jgi:hypothetical protein